MRSWHPKCSSLVSGGGGVQRKCRKARQTDSLSKWLFSRLGKKKKAVADVLKNEWEETSSDKSVFYFHFFPIKTTKMHPSQRKIWGVNTPLYSINEGVSHPL
jgi:hypothetical protein